MTAGVTPVANEVLRLCTEVAATAANTDRREESEAAVFLATALLTQTVDVRLASLASDAIPLSQIVVPVRSWCARARE